MSAIEDLRATMARLRAPDGCPWDQEQTHATLVRCLIDEVSELIDTIDRQDYPHMREELGDVLIQIVFHAQIAEEQGHFDFEDVAREINDKLVRRHPARLRHGAIETSEQVIVRSGREIKATEKKHGPAAGEGAIFKELPPRLPALMFAEAVWKQIEKKSLPVEGASTSRRWRNWPASSTRRRWAGGFSSSRRRRGSAGSIPKGRCGFTPRCDAGDVETAAGNCGGPAAG
jgi:uncharacterized protein YabN with tetrapyrrole methylase and pyrophosphatase domain